MKYPTAEEVAKRLEMSSSSISSFKSGKVVCEERDSSNEKDLCLLVACKVKASVADTYKFVTEERVIEIQEATLAQGSINTSTFELEGFKFDHGTGGNITKYAMSKAEKKHVMGSSDKQAAFKKMLSERAKKYWHEGVKGMEPYEGKNHNLGDDISTATKECLKVVKDPIMREEVVAVPAKSKHPELHSLFWTIVQGNDITSIVINHRVLRYKEGDGFIAVTNKVYSGVDFDASQILVGVTHAGEEECAIFYINRVYTAAVAGFGGSVKRSVGRKLMKDTVAKTMTKAQTVLGNQ